MALPELRTAAVVGTGLIGTSVALALTARGVTTYLIDRDEAAARTAAALGAGTFGAPPAPVDLAVLAVPPATVAEVLEEHQKDGLAQAYTDVASVKGRPQAELAARGCDLTSFVGGHPMAGRERSGPRAGRADLFDGRPWVLTPHPATRSAVLRRGLELVRLCGSVPVVLGPEAHDRAVALVSHVPHLLATLMAARLCDGEGFAYGWQARGCAMSPGSPRATPACGRTSSRPMRRPWRRSWASSPRTSTRCCGRCGRWPRLPPVRRGPAPPRN